ncbi:MAG TPA: AMP-binding protein [Rhizomicrobium sp.]|nr:AMP-binding protein [Rhizomicrobium sp.]
MESFPSMHGLAKDRDLVADFLAFRARANAERVACIDLPANRQLTYRELADAADRCAGWLASLLLPGARVAMLMRNSVDILIVHFACARAGMIFVPLNWRLSGLEIGGLLEDATPDLFIYHTEFAEQAASALEKRSVQHVVSMAPGNDPLAATVAKATPLGPRESDPDAPMTLLYTSGTTGRPKGVIITGRNAWSTAFNFTMSNAVAPGDAMLCDMPLFHVSGLFGVAWAAIFAGASVLISDRFVSATALRLMSDRKLGITHYFAVPQMASTMLQDPSWSESDLSRLKALVIGGAPLAPIVVEQLLNSGVTPLEGYGSSEAGTVFGMPIDRDAIRRKPESCGVAAMRIDVRLVDSERHDVADGEVGEIWLKGPSVTPGYWQQPEATAKAFHNGWFKTGDAAMRDAEGFYRIVDRWKDMYITGGENVYPAEVESVLATHPSVAEAAVIGVVDARWGEAGCAYIVPRGPIDEAEIVSYCRARLAHYKVPRYVRVAETLPRTGSGKVRKDELRHAFRED